MIRQITFKDTCGLASFDQSRVPCIGCIPVWVMPFLNFPGCFDEMRVVFLLSIRTWSYGSLLICGETLRCQSHRIIGRKQKFWKSDNGSFLSHVSPRPTFCLWKSYLISRGSREPSPRVGGASWEYWLLLAVQEGNEISHITALHSGRHTVNIHQMLDIISLLLSCFIASSSSSELWCLQD